MQEAENEGSHGSHTSTRLRHLQQFVESQFESSALDNPDRQQVVKFETELKHISSNKQTELQRGLHLSTSTPRPAIQTNPVTGAELKSGNVHGTPLNHSQSRDSPELPLRNMNTVLNPAAELKSRDGLTHRRDINSILNPAAEPYIPDMSATSKLHNMTIQQDMCSDLSRYL